MTHKKISLITVCKGRLMHLKQTFPRNLNWNKKYPKIEFVLLDYNSEDGMESWVKKYFQKEINGGILSYYKFPEPQYFHFSHSRNMAFRLAKGDILCNVDADNFTCKDYAFYINEITSLNNFAVGCRVEDTTFLPTDQDNGCTGRFAVHRNDFLKTGGYDERMKNWGYEDIDMYRRLSYLGCRGTKIDDYFLHAISHTDDERIEHSNIQYIYQQRKNIKMDVLNTSVDKHAAWSEDNINQGKYILNDGRFGCGTVFKNLTNQKITIDRIMEYA